MIKLLLSIALAFVAMPAMSMSEISPFNMPDSAATNTVHRTVDRPLLVVASCRDDDGDDGDDGEDHDNCNNGVGNGEDCQPPGDPPINDGPGTSPGNPGNKPD